MNDAALVLSAAVLFVLGVLTSGCETAFFAADRLRLRHLASLGRRRARRALNLAADPERVLTTLLATYTLAEVGCSAVCTALATRWFGESATTVVTLTLVPVWLVFNQIIPKVIFLSYATTAAVFFADSIRVASLVMMPLVRPTARVTEALTDALPAGDTPRPLNVSMEELLLHIGDSRSAGLLAPETTAFIDRAIELKSLSVRDVMTPIAAVTMLDADADVDSYVDVISREGFSRYPVYRDARTNVIGILTVHEFVTAHNREALRENLREPYFVAEDARISDIMDHMRDVGRHMAMVRDTTGQLVGMTTLDDVLKRLVGVIVDEFD
ncbi:MAG TPA: CNNM domain-containing protein [Candidatus Krumholzibacteria bacterium]|nr:CNNM domain-containing protein [Candidatus Krumholzibacteria bacterium]